MPRISDAKVEKVLELFSQGLSISEIAEQVKLSEKTVRRILSDHGLSVPEAPESSFEEDKLAESLVKTSERTATALMNRVTRSIVETVIKSGIITGLELIDKYKWVAFSWGYNKVDEFVKDAIEFYINYYPVVHHLNERINTIEKIYTATYVTLEKLYKLIAGTYLNLLTTLVDAYVNNKITYMEFKESVELVSKVIYDAIDRIEGRSIQEIIGSSSETRNANSGYSGEVGGGDREDDSEGYNSQAHDDGGEESNDG